MKIEGGSVIFRSMPEFFHKEKNSLKCCTVRTITKSWYNPAKKQFEDRDEYKAFEMFRQQFEKIKDKNIMIVNAETEEWFTRRLTDISQFEDHWILSWDGEGK